MSPGRASPQIERQIEWLQMTPVRTSGNQEDGRGKRGVWLSNETAESRAVQGIVDAA
jgi:hypothetical protein